MMSTQRSRKAWTLAGAVTAITSGAFLLNARDDLYILLRADPFISLALGWGGIGVGLVTILVFYLRGEFGNSPDLPDGDVIISKQADKSLDALAAVAATLDSAIVARDAETAKIPIRDHARVISATRVQDADGVQNSGSHAQIRANFAAAIRRLEREALALSRRANANLAIGSIIITVGIGAVLYLLTPTAERQTLQEFAIYYAPRLVTLACTEIFGFFFLRMYKINLTEIKYYQNELTTLALHWNAFEAMPTDSGSPAPIVVEQFAKADRNRSAESVKEVKVDTAIDPKTVATLLERVADIVKSVK